MSLTSNRPPFDESCPEVIRRRSEELASGRVVSIPWSEVKKSAREACDGRGPDQAPEITGP